MTKTFCGMKIFFICVHHVTVLCLQNHYHNDHNEIKSQDLRHLSNLFQHWTFNHHVMHYCVSGRLVQ